VNALRTLGYEAVWQGERSWNGVAILARKSRSRADLRKLAGGILKITKPATSKRLFRES